MLKPSESESENVTPGHRAWVDSGVKRNFWPLRNSWPIIVCQLFCFWE